jgi:uncharacterized protein YkwD
MLRPPLGFLLAVVCFGAFLLPSPAWAALPLDWAHDTHSPRPAPASDSDVILYRSCGQRDLGLVQVAARVVARKLSGKGPFSDHQLKELTRAAGVPQPWPRAWLVSKRHRIDDVSARLSRWLERQPPARQRRCGVARGADKSGDPVFAVVTVDALADQAELPRQVRTSQWLHLDAAIHAAEANGAKVVLLGPTGRPRRVLSSLSGGRLRSRFTLDHAGRWLIQVVANLDSGPTPVLESVVFADAEPPNELSDGQRGDHVPPSASSLLSLINKARRREGLRSVKRNPELDGVAHRHVLAMVAAQMVAHDVGDGLPHERLSEAGVDATRVGENVASAPTLRRIHRVLWDSPSHRENLLDPGFSRVGVALVRDSKGKLWAAEVFTP